MTSRTRLGSILKILNIETGLVASNWGNTVLMAIVMGLFLLFLIIILQIYNSSLLLEDVDIDWVGV